jgi:hypothetical protein
MVACHAHAPAVRAGGVALKTLGLKAGEKLIAKKAPGLLESIREFIKTRKELAG